MGVDTKLVIKSDIELDDVIEFIENRWNTKVKVEMPNRKICSNMYVFNFDLETDDKEIKARYSNRKECRTMFVHTNSNEYVLSPATSFSLGRWGRSVEILRSIAETFGGILQPEDCTEEYEYHKGKMYKGDGIAWHLYRYFIENPTALHNVAEDFVYYLKREGQLKALSEYELFEGKEE